MLVSFNYTNTKDIADNPILHLYPSRRSSTRCRSTGNYDNYGGIRASQVLGRNMEERPTDGGSPSGKLRVFLDVVADGPNGNRSSAPKDRLALSQVALETIMILDITIAPGPYK